MICKSCKITKLITTKEKLTGTCDICAKSANEGFSLMAKGKFREGFKKVMDVNFSRDESSSERVIAEAKIRKALSRKENLIRKKLKRKGLSEDEIEEGLKKFREGVN